MLRFGTGGIPISAKEHNVFSGIERIRELGLDSMELEFVYQTWLSEKDAEKVRELSKKLDVALTSHGSYYINLNAEDKKKIHASISRISKAAEICQIAGVKSLTFHPGFYLKKKPSEAYAAVRESLKLLEKELKSKSVSDVKISLETTGKQSQFGTVEEIVFLSKEFDFIFPCIDFSHIYTRSLGKSNTLTDFQKVLDVIKDNLGKKAIEDLHIHMSGIAYGKSGERNHLNLEESEFNYKAALMALSASKAGGYVTCESPSLEKDSLLMKRFFQSISKN